MSAQTTSKVTGKIIGCVQHDCEQCKARDTEVATAHRQAKTAMDDYQQAVKSYAIELSNRNAEVAALQANLTESQRLNAVAKGFIVVSKDLLAEAIACNTDASLADARHIINSVLKVSDDEIFREALKELAAMK